MEQGSSLASRPYMLEYGVADPSPCSKTMVRIPDYYFCVHSPWLGARAVTFDFHYTYTFDFHYSYVYRQASLICKVLGYLLIRLPLLICIRMTTAACTWLVSEQLWEIRCQSYVHNQCCQCIEKVTHRYTISVRTYILELSDNYRSGCAWSLHHNGVYSHIMHLTHISRHLKAVVVAYPLV